MASSGDKFVYFLMGGFIGAAVALLLAPKSGEETRRFLDDVYQEGADHLGEKIRDGKDFIAEKSREVVEDVEEKIEQGKETVEQTKKHIAAAVEAGVKVSKEKKKSVS